MQKSRISNSKSKKIGSIFLAIPTRNIQNAGVTFCGHTGGACQVYHPDLSGRIRHGLRDDIRPILQGGEEVQIKQGWPKSESNLVKTAMWEHWVCVRYDMILYEYEH